MARLGSRKRPIETATALERKLRSLQARGVKEFTARGEGGVRFRVSVADALRAARRARASGRARRRLVHPNRAHKHRTATGLRACSKRG
jgi:hypothetical protein